MIWMINSATFCKGLRIKFKDDIITFRWKNPPKSLWTCKKPIYICLKQKSIDIKNELLSFNDINKKHFLKYTESYYGEYEDYYGNVHESDYLTYETINVDDTEEYIKKLKLEKEKIENKIFLIKKIYPNILCGGWGILISKEEFIININK
jgi:hypothetical protein